MPIIFTNKVNQGSSCRVRFQLRGLDAIPVAVANIISATLTLRDKSSDAVIGTTDRNVAGGFFDGDTTYNFSYTFATTDSAIISTNTQLGSETHVARLKVVVNAGAGIQHTLEEEFYIKVDRLDN